MRNKPAYPYPYTEPTESTLQTEGTEDTSYYYTYEDISEDASKQVTSSITTATPPSTSKPPVRSFWNSQKAQLDARRKESAQKFVPTYNKPSSVPKEKPVIEFKVREKPKFGLASKNKQFTTTQKPEVTTTKPTQASTTNKSVKSDFKLNLPIQNLSEKDLLKSFKNINLSPNQLIGRIGELPMQNNLASQIQSQLKAQSSNINNFGSTRPNKFDNPLPNPSNAQNQPNLQNLLNSLKSQPLLNLNQQRSTSLNQPAQSSSQAIQTLLNLNQNQKPSGNLNQNQQPVLNFNQQPRLNNNNVPLANTFIAASAPIGNSGRSGEITIQAPSAASSLLQRLGALGIGGTGAGDNVLGRSAGGGGYGGGSGISLNLGSVPDPLMFFLKLLQLIPRPLLDLNGKIFFGIELGKNAGLVSGAGAAKPGYSG